MTKPKSQSIGDRIKLVRGDTSQTEFAELLGISRSSLLRYESEQSKLDADLLARLWVLFKADPLWLITGHRQADPVWGNSEVESRLIATFGQLDERGKDHLLATARLLADLTKRAK